MKKVKSLKISYLFLIAGCFLLSLMACFISTPALQTKADSSLLASYSSNLNITTQNHEGETISSVPGTTTLVYEGATTTDYAYSSLNWSDLRNFVVSFDISSIPDATNFEYSYSVSWTPAVITDGKADFSTAHTVTKDIFKKTAATKSDVITEFNFIIDDLSMEGENVYRATKILQDANNNLYQTHGGWGLYVFSFNYSQTGALTSAVLEVKPTDVNTLEEPTVKITEKSSNLGMKSSYLFTLSDSFKYVDRSLMVWYIEGIGRDGLKYVLTPSDIEEISDKPIYDTSSYYRNGYSFDFDTSIEGTWTTTCKIYTQTPEEGISPKYEVSSAEVSTEKGMTTQAIIWIVVGAAIIASIIVAVTIVVSIKREKVY